MPCAFSFYHGETSILIAHVAHRLDSDLARVIVVVRKYRCCYMNYTPTYFFSLFCWCLGPFSIQIVHIVPKKSAYASRVRFGDTIHLGYVAMPFPSPLDT